MCRSLSISLYSLLRRYRQKRLVALRALLLMDPTSALCTCPICRVYLLRGPSHCTPGFRLEVLRAFRRELGTPPPDRSNSTVILIILRIIMLALTTGRCLRMSSPAFFVLPQILVIVIGENLMNTFVFWKFFAKERIQTKYDLNISFDNLSDLELGVVRALESRNGQRLRSSLCV